MKITFQLFGQLKDFFPAAQFEAVIEKEELTVAEIKNWLVGNAQHPERVRELTEKSALATASHILQGHETIRDADVIFVLPPVCGG